MSFLGFTSTRLALCSFAWRHSHEKNLFDPESLEPGTSRSQVLSLSYKGPWTHYQKSQKKQGVENNAEKAETSLLI